MRVAGIIAEYNPLHNGHVYHMERTREATKCDYIIVVMSGDYVQRGEPAIADKYTRAQWALLAGADLVLELPAVCAVSSAERFAAGGVRVLAGTGVLNCLCFGSETPDTEELIKAAEALKNEPPAFREALKEQLALGKSYPRARYDALESCGAPNSLLKALSTPNSILGMEYVRFLQQYAPQAEPIAIHRMGAGYNDTALSGAFSSATAIREALVSRNRSAYEGMPMYVGGYFKLGDNRCVTLPDADSLILYALRMMSAEDMKSLPDVQEGFENVLYRASREAKTTAELLTLLKSKRYTLARCKRICICAMLGVTSRLAKSAFEEDALYLRVLGFRRTARSLVSAIAGKRTLPMLVRRSDTATLTASTQAILEADIRAHDVYALIAKQEAPQRDFCIPPIVI